MSSPRREERKEEEGEGGGVLVRVPTRAPIASLNLPLPRPLLLLSSNASNHTSKSDSPPYCCVASRQLSGGTSPPLAAARRLQTSCMTARADAQFPTPSACSSASSLRSKSSRSASSSARHPQRQIPKTTLRRTERATLLLLLPAAPPAGTRCRHSIVSRTLSRISGQPGCSPESTVCRYTRAVARNMSAVRRRFSARFAFGGVGAVYSTPLSEGAA